MYVTVSVSRKRSLLISSQRYSPSFRWGKYTTDHCVATELAGTAPRAWCRTTQELPLIQPPCAGYPRQGYSLKTDIPYSVVA